MHNLKEISWADFPDYKIQTPHGVKQLVDLIIEQKAGFTRYLLPAKLPPQTVQVGPNCGIYAVYNLWKNSGLIPLRSIPPPRKLDLNSTSEDKSIDSLRSILKKKLLTGFGAIYNIYHFSDLAKTLGFPRGITIFFSHNLNEYIETICRFVESNHAITVSCELNEIKMFPGANSGFGAHWATILGFIEIKQICHFIVAQHEKCCLWNGNDLFESNFKLPEKNPFFGDHIKKKSEQRGRSSYPRVSSKAITGKKIYRVEEETLDYFRFTGYAYPSSYVKNSINELDFMLNYAKKFFITINHQPLFLDGFAKISAVIDWLIQRSQISSDLHQTYLNYFSDFFTKISDQKRANILLEINSYYLNHNNDVSKSYFKRLELSLNYFLSQQKLKKIHHIISEKDFTAIYKILLKRLIDWVAMGRLQEIIEIKKIFPKLPLDQLDHRGRSILIVAADEKQFDIISWLLKNGLTDQCIDSKGNTCSNILVNSLLEEIKETSHKINFINALIDQRQFSLHCLLYCLTDVSYFLKINSLLILYFKLVEIKQFDPLKFSLEDGRIKSAIRKILFCLNSTNKFDLSNLLKETESIFITMPDKMENKNTFFSQNLSSSIENMTIANNPCEWPVL